MRLGVTIRNNARVLSPARRLLVLALLLGSTMAVAAPRDKPAEKKIQEAIFTHFLNTDFDTAEGLLLGTIRACEDKCSATVIARAWMYVGVVRGSGRNDTKGAEEAFGKALSADPGVMLDSKVSTPALSAMFDKVAGRKGAPSKGSPSKGPPVEAAGMTCVPDVTEVESRRPVPLQCESDKDITSAKLHYKSFDGSWSAVTMTAKDGTFRGTIPCAATQSTGTLRYYVEGLDDGRHVVTQLGTQKNPKTAEVVSETQAAPPAFPGEQPPARCSVESAGEAGGGGPHAEGCGSWGGKCGEDGCCDSGLACVNGTCESAECKGDSDCPGGASCVDGKCGGEKAVPGTYAKNLLSLQFGVDIANISTDKACDPSSRADHFACYEGSATYQGQPSPVGAGVIHAGFALATMRLLASYERLFGSIGLEGRVGFAFNGGKTPQGGSAFLPVHAEARGKFWILGASAFEKPGLRPWVHLGGGLAQVDVTVKNVQIADCPTATPEQLQYCTSAPDLLTAARPVTLPNGQLYPGAPIKKVDATKQLGLGFVSFGGGVMFAIGTNHGALLGLNAMIMLPSTGFVLEPSLGYTVAF